MFGSSWYLWKALKNKTPAELPGSINTRFISQSPYYMVMTMISLLWGKTPMASLFEKEIPYSYSFIIFLVMLEDMMFVVKSFLA